MKNLFSKCNFPCKINTSLLFLLILFLSFKGKAQQTLTQIDGWNAYVHLPAGYATSGKNYPTIIFMPGIGEIGTNANLVIAQGPGAYLTQGWNGNISVDGNTIEFIVISLQPPAAYPNEYLINIRLQSIKRNYRVDNNKVFLTGLSHGGWCSSTFVTGDAYGGPYTYASQIAAIATVEGVTPDDNSPYPNLFDNFASSGGKLVCLEQRLDGRGGQSVVNRMNNSVPGSAQFVETNFGNAGHCCWSEFYGGGGKQPGVFGILGRNQTIYEFFARVAIERGAVNANQPPTAFAGADQNITLPVNTITLTGAGTDPDGTIVAYNWVKSSGPAANIANANAAITQINNLVQGVYNFILTVTDNSGTTAIDTVQITVDAAANQSPTAFAGADQNITLPVNTITLTGSGTDPDGTIVAYNWVKSSGPAANIANANAATTQINNLVQGVYNFILTVTDNEGSSSKDTITLTVNPPLMVSCNNNAPVTYYLNYTSAPGEIYRPNGAAWKGGDTVIITGTNYSVIEFYNINGDACRPIVIMPKTVLSTPVFRIKGNSKFLKIWGGPTQYGIKITNGSLAISQSSFIEAKNIEIFGGSVGVYCKQDPYYNQPETWGNDSNAMSNIKFRNLYIHDINGEGMYIGHTSPNGLLVRKPNGADTLIIPIQMDSIEVSDCILERTQWDGIQLSHARAGNKIFNNIIRNYGMLNMSSQQAGIILGGNTTGDIYNNKIFKGTGNGIEAFGYGVINIYNNVLDSCGYDGSTLGQQTVYASDYVTSTVVNPKQTMNIYGNAINHPTLKAGIFITGYFGNSFPSSVYNNTFCLTNPPANWESIYMRLYVPGTTTSNNTLSCATVPPPPNQAPNANAGADKTITLPVNNVSLVGTGSDVDGTIVNYQWLKISGPAAGIITTANASNSTVTGLVQGVYLLKFTVTDNLGAQGSDTIKITVNAAANQAPSANAGLDQNISLPVSTANLTGSATDPDGTIASYKWTKLSGPAAGNISNSNIAITTATGLVQGVYKFRLTVTDNAGATAFDDMQVTVNAAANQAPSANAGLDQNITLPVSTANLIGSATDPDGTIVTYLWTKISGPAAGNISNSNIGITTATGLVQGVYIFRLTVTDNGGATAFDEMRVTVNSATNQTPSANAGLDQTLTLPINNTSLTGTGADPDGSITNYNWTKISGPAAGVITNSNNASTTVTALVQGVYVFRLKVTDNSGATAIDDVQVTVNAAANQEPTAFAGADQFISLPVNTANLNGSGNDPDGSIVSYAWSKISGPAAGIITNTANASTTVTALVQGVYTFRLTVTDNAGVTAFDDMKITVEVAASPVNQKPVANAGNDINIYLPDNSVQVNGTGTDVDGLIVSYQWRIFTNNSGYTVSDIYAAQSEVGNLQQGIYLLELTVTDNSGETGKDTMQITVGSNRNSGGLKINIFPNPVQEVLNINIDKGSVVSDKARIRIINVNGAEVLQKNISLIQNGQTERIIVSQLAAGNYILTFILDDGKVLTKIFVKL